MKLDKIYNVKKLGSGEIWTMGTYSDGSGCGIFFNFGSAFGSGQGNGIYRIREFLSEGGAGHSFGFKNGSGGGDETIQDYKYTIGYSYNLILNNL